MSDADFRLVPIRVPKNDNCSILVIALNVAKETIKILSDYSVLFAAAEERGGMYGTAAIMQPPCGRRLGHSQTH